MTYGIISEFNPFHNGHKWLIDRVKSTDNAIVTVMSSSFVQRGDVSVINKIDKTRAALLNGVDLVLELPAVYSLKSAEGFASAATRILKSTCVIDTLLFGSECGDTNKLIKASKISENEQLQARINYHMKNGEYYPKAMYNSIAELYGAEFAEIYSNANNILGIEYIKSLKGTDIKPLTFKRFGTGHDSESAKDNIASGSFIRNNYSDRELYTPEYDITDSAEIKNIEKLIVYKLAQMTPEEIRNIPDVTEGIENRIIDGAKDNISFTALCNYIKTKRYTMARIRRILCSALLGITQEISNYPVPYIRVLGFTEKGKSLLKTITEKSELPVIINVKSGYDKLDYKGKKVLETEMLASKIWSLAGENGTIIKNDFQQEIIKI